MSPKKWAAILTATFLIAICTLAAISYSYTNSPRPVDNETGACSCDSPDHYEVFYLEKGKEYFRTSPAVTFIAEPRNVVMPEELSWLYYGMSGGIPPFVTYYMGGTPTVTGTYLCSFDVFPLGHVHLLFVIYEA